MSWLSNIWRNLFHRRDVERDIDDEVRAAFRQLLDEKVRAGMAPDDARRAAGLELGGVEFVKEQIRGVKAGAFVDTLLGDTRYAARLLRRNPLFTITAALSLAIGIGATTTIFTVANGLLLRAPEGVTEPERLVDIYHTEEDTRFANPMSFYSAHLDVRERSRTLQDTFAYQVDLLPVSLSGADGATRIFGCLASPNYFTVLGVRPAAGRMFGVGDGERAGESPVVVLSHRFWTTHYDNDPGVVGQTVRLNGYPVTVIGVAAEGFRGTSVLAPDVWIPAPMVERLMRGGTLRGLQVMIGGRLRSGVPLSQAAAEIELIGRALDRGRMRDVAGVIMPAAAGGLGVAASSPIPGNLRLIVGAFVAVLMTLVSLVLVIACANLAGALLARASTRRREIAVRLALGVGRMRLIRQLLTETVLLFLIGGCTGLLLARGMTSLLVSLLPEFPQPVAVTLALDYRVVGFATVLSLVAALLCGLAPALQASKADVVSTLKDDAQAPVERLRLRNAFVVAQVAFSILLVVAAGVFVERLQNISAIDRGFDARGIDIASLDLSMAGYTEETGPPFVEAISERVGRLSNVEMATVADRPPSPGRIMGMMGDLTAPGVEPPKGQRGFMGNWYTVGLGYFAALRIPLVAGRDFTTFDRAGGQAVVIVSQSTARRLWPGEDAIGKTLLWQSGGRDGPASPKRSLTVVGVATDLEGRDRDIPGLGSALTLYVPLRQRYTPQLTIFARPRNSQPVSRAIVALIASMDRNLPILSAGTLEDELSGPDEVQLRIAASVSGSVGLIGVLLAGIGIYGVTAYAVARRTREIGIRLALGADRAVVIGMVLRQGMSLVALGSAIGLILAAAATRVLAGTLFGIQSLGIMTFGGAVVLFAVIGLAACYAPTRRATRINAMDALRYE